MVNSVQGNQEIDCHRSSLTPAVDTCSCLLEVDVAVCHRIENCHTGPEQINPYASRSDLADKDLNLSRLEGLDQLWPLFSIVARKSFCGRVSIKQLLLQGEHLGKVSTEDNDGASVTFLFDDAVQLAQLGASHLMGVALIVIDETPTHLVEATNLRDAERSCYAGSAIDGHHHIPRQDVIQSTLLATKHHRNKLGVAWREFEHFRGDT